MAIRLRQASPTLMAAMVPKPEGDRLAVLIDAEKEIAERLSAIVEISGHEVIKLEGAEQAEDRRSEIQDNLQKRSEDLVAISSSQKTPDTNLDLVIIEVIAEQDVMDGYHNSYREQAGEEADGESKHSGSPLTYRKTLESMSEEDHVGLRFAGYSVPKIFVGWFDLPGVGQPVEPWEKDLLFLDSSIWHRFVNLADMSTKSVVWDELAVRLEDVRRWYSEGRYYYRTSLEYLDYSIRMLRHQRLAPFGKDGAHASYVTLHGFHSELHAEKRHKRQLKRLRAPQGQAVLPSRFLLVDDKAGVFLTMPGDLAEARIVGEKCNSKREIVESEIGAAEGERTIDIRVAATVEQAWGLLRREKDVQKGVDVILLDYLLEKSDGTGWRQYGSDLLDKLEPEGEEEGGEGDQEESQEEDLVFGPFNQHWVFPISGFSTAFYAEMRQGRLEAHARRYRLASGADPLCTPALFKEKLLKFQKTMWGQVHSNPKSRIQPNGTSKADEKRESGTADDKLGRTVLGEFLVQFSKAAVDRDHREGCREIARDYYSRLVSFRETLGELAELCNTTGSPFANFVLEDWGEPRRPLGHLTALVRKLAWGSGMEWAESLDEIQRLREYSAAGHSIWAAEIFSEKFLQAAEETVQQMVIGHRQGKG